ncbi:MAG TPA: FecR domain-containing protein [Polyangiaceae bacterium]|jgi:ferric-dicitrate binding protein FerR (iron transport regulator)|nr:FecR domain-containing protein [Polyangiaceae bacterium]
MAIERPLLGARHIAVALRTLFAEHAREREAFDKRRAWQRIERQFAGAQGNPPKSNRFALSFALATALLGAIAFGVYRSSVSTLRYEARGTTLIDGILCTGEAPGALDFSDRSHISAGPHTAFSIEVVGTHAALMRLVRGQLHVSVHHEPSTHWRFFAGRYEVQVVGTEFDLAWNEKSETISLEMVSGEVRVLGAPGVVRVVKGGSVLRLPEAAGENVAAAVVNATPSANEEPAATSALDQTNPLAVTATEPDRAKRAHASPELGASGPAAPESVAWSSLLKSGQFSAVVSAAEARGVERVLESDGAANLKALAQAARYTGRAQLSLQAWQSLRRRFAAESLGVEASFFLARSYEEAGNAGEALRWLDTYVSEAPAGVYASEACGRRLLLLKKIGGRAAAIAGAREYLNRFPGGPYEKTAHAILESD